MKHSIFFAVSIAFISLSAAADDSAGQKVSMNDLIKLESKVCTSVDTLQSNIKAGNRPRACLELGTLSADSNRLESVGIAYGQLVSKGDKTAEKGALMTTPSAEIKAGVDSMIDNHYCGTDKLDSRMLAYFKKGVDTMIAKCQFMKETLLDKPTAVDSNLSSEAVNHSN